VYNLATFISSFPYPNIEVGTIAIGVVVAGVMACRGRDSGLKSEVGWDINKVIVGVLLGINWGIRFCRVLYFKLCINTLVSILDLKVLLGCSL
jgi:hypothetical protein